MRLGVVAPALALSALLVAGCTTPDASLATQGAVFDPYEAENRRVHAFNKGVDRAILRPVAMGYTAVLPDGVEDNISHFAANLSVPGAALNQVMQGDLNGATRNVVRFAVNSTLGFAGLADVATDLGLPEDDADFGQTLAVWGLPQGAYLELPLIGPASERDAAGKIVDFAISPLRGLEQPEAGIATGARVAAGIGQRGRFASTIDSVLYDSVDSYSATRTIYLQNRAFDLGDAADGVQTDEIDPYEELFGE